MYRGDDKALIMMKNLQILLGVVCFLVLPVLFFFTGDVEHRTWLKDGLSLLTLLSFFIMILQFFLSRAYASGLKEYKMSQVIKWHKILGYVFVGVLIFHPFLIVIPRYFETGVAPAEAFMKILQQWSNPGLLLGFVAFGVMLLLGLTSLLRSHLNMTYNHWRILHGVLSIIFILCACFHVIYMGRHMSGSMSVLIVFLSFIAVGLQVKKMMVTK